MIDDIHPEELKKRTKELGGSRRGACQIDSASGVAQKWRYISNLIFDGLKGLERGYKRTEIYVQHH
jgi:hypothetical protein